jgi:histidinol-phosphate aminotransferase
MTEWSRLVVPAPPEGDPFDIGGVAEIMARLGLAEAVKLHWNENLFGTLPGVLEAVQAELESLWMYPEDPYDAFRADVGAALDVAPQSIYPGHGTQTLIGVLATTFLRQGDTVVVPELTYYLYGTACAARGAAIERVPMRDLRIDLEAMLAAADRTRARIVWVCDPNNPTGDVLSEDEWASFLDQLPDGCVAIVDEAYVDFRPVRERVPRVADVRAGRPVVLLRTFSKLYGLAGLRLGYAVVDEELARYLALVEEPYNVSLAAIAAGRACLRAGEAADRRRAEVAAARAVLADGLREAGLEPRPSVANFVLVRLDVDDVALTDGLARRGLLIRAGTDFGLPGYVRITVGPAELMRRVTAAVQDVCAELRG